MFAFDFRHFNLNCLLPEVTLIVGITVDIVMVSFSINTSTQPWEE